MEVSGAPVAAGSKNLSAARWRKAPGDLESLDVGEEDSLHVGGDRGDERRWRAEATSDGVSAASSIPSRAELRRRQSSRHVETRVPPRVFNPVQPDVIPRVLLVLALPSPAYRTGLKCFMVFLDGPVIYTQKLADTLLPNEA